MLEMLQDVAEVITVVARIVVATMALMLFVRGLGGKSRDDTAITQAILCVIAVGVL